jgi:hypothetical protein
MMALEIENKKADNAANDSELDAQVKSQEVATKAEVDKYVADLRAQVDIALEQLKAGHAVDLKGVEYTLANAPIEVENESIKATGAAVGSLTQELNRAIGDINSAISELRDASEAERELVRDDKGQVTGIRVNGKVKDVKRDKNGRITGI